MLHWVRPILPSILSPAESASTSPCRQGSLAGPGSETSDLLLAPAPHLGPDPRYFPLWGREKEACSHSLLLLWPHPPAGPLHFHHQLFQQAPYVYTPLVSPLFHSPMFVRLSIPAASFLLPPVCVSVSVFLGLPLSPFLPPVPFLHTSSTGPSHSHTSSTVQPDILSQQAILPPLYRGESPRSTNANANLA